jgi:D-alanine-D-alanine ligase
MVLAGGPDRERPVSIQSGATVAAALREAGHAVLVCDPSPSDASFLDAFAAWGGDVVFPALHGPWGEGGPAQRMMQDRGVAFVGCRADAADLCMDKVRTKQRAIEHGVPTAAFEVVSPGSGETPRDLRPPFVIKAPREGSSVELFICHDEAAAAAAFADLGPRHETLLVERFIKGKEITVGVLGGEPLPPIHIAPATAYYDYQAKYERDDTRYLVGKENINLPGDVLDAVSAHATAAYRACGCRHLSRVDFIVDDEHRPWLLEINTMPGFTSHSLLPMAAKHAGWTLAGLVDHLVRMAVGERAADPVAS